MSKRVGRVAFREEGDRWVACYALNDTMKEALFFGAIALGAVQKDEGVKGRFIALMRDLVANAIEQRFGVRPQWREPETAPEHERSGRA